MWCASTWADVDGIVCRRCNRAMEARVATPRAGGKPVRADVCARCGALWLDEEELSEIDGRLAALPFKRPLLEQEARPSGAHDACPGCGAPPGEGPVEVTIVDVCVDFCMCCGGVWLDGGEIEALARSAREAAANETVAGYRAAPRLARALATGRFACARCEADTPLDKSCVMPSGLLCELCYQHVLEESRDRGDNRARDAMLRDRLARRRSEDPPVDLAAKLVDFLQSFLPWACPFCLRLHPDKPCPKA